jgi:hypothetical protein
MERQIERVLILADERSPDSASFVLHDFFEPAGGAQTESNQQASYVSCFIDERRAKAIPGAGPPVVGFDGFRRGALSDRQNRGVVTWCGNGTPVGAKGGRRLGDTYRRAAL